ncbi:exosortase K [Algibacter sp. 2305UL17-15]|uniref:exosortase K n=1 Tax=Algibacter sp. 2305UL17-15 TaxID=3231268 RepID=UPI0034576C1A
MKLPKHSAYYITGILLFIILKLMYSNANNSQVFILLKPLDTIISFILDSHSVYNPDFGFYHETQNITIDKSCSGFNFLMLSFVLIYFSVLKNLKSHFFKIIAIPLTLFFAFAFTQFVNASRILTAIFIEKNTNFNYDWLHEAEGVFIYLSFLITLYISINYVQNKIIHTHEKLT